MEILKIKETMEDGNNKAIMDGINQTTITVGIRTVKMFGIMFKVMDKDMETITITVGEGCFPGNDLELLYCFFKKLSKYKIYSKCLMCFIFRVARRIKIR